MAPGACRRRGVFYFTSSDSVTPSAFTTPKVGSYRPASSLLTYSRVVFAFAASAGRLSATRQPACSLGLHESSQKLKCL